MDILITYFPPFDGHPINISKYIGKVVYKLVKKHQKFLKVRVHLKMLPVANPHEVQKKLKNIFNSSVQL